MSRLIHQPMMCAKGTNKPKVHNHMKKTGINFLTYG